MDVFDILTLICGLSLFLFGMNVMSDSLKKSAGNKLKATLGKMTSNKWKGFLLGLAVTAVIQSSGATTVMVVGFVNSGTMTLSQAIGVILGANVGTAVTSWLTGLSGIGGASYVLQFIKPSEASWISILAIVGIFMILIFKRGRKHDLGTIFLGFVVLMIGMETMSSAVSELGSNPDFQAILTAFENPLLGILVGIVLTTIVQSSSASIGILQSMTATGAITYGAAIPIIMGQNIGACVTTLISSTGANKNGKRAALIHLYFNIIGVGVVLAVFYILNGIFKFTFVGTSIGTIGVAAVHTLFKIISVVLIGPFSKQLEKLAYISIKEGKDAEKTNMLDERLLKSPTIAVQRAEDVTRIMADIAFTSIKKSLGLLFAYDKKTADAVRDEESRVDVYEDALGSYLVKISAENMTEKDSHDVTKLLHLIGDFERISDHAVNIVESAEEITDNKVDFTNEARHEIDVLSRAVCEILDLSMKSFYDNDLDTAALVEPLEQTVDYLRDTIKSNHIRRLQNNECTIEHGFVLADILTNCERVADHCSNIAGCVIEISKYDALNMHEYLKTIKSGERKFNENYQKYMEKYAL
ncbi:MAG: Na/Pi cotransporter family protein [Clostridia bacterium]|nr:Na/Pi cotransporter family protein [Clostridia bacterium]MBO4428700.1 Na/Pi cotransporter family protein [Clostridia bacterium]